LLLAVFVRLIVIKNQDYSSLMLILIQPAGGVVDKKVVQL
jgi:hypothetical protein